MPAVRFTLSDRHRSMSWHASDGVKIIEAFECFPVMTSGELALRTGISQEEAARYLLTLKHLGLAETDGENFWLDPQADASGTAVQ